MDPLFKTRLPSGAELFSTGWCNLNCKYCYIPKTDMMKNLHKEIAKKLDSGQYVEDLKKMYPPNKLFQLSLWGTEPSLTIPKFAKWFQEISDYFPNLHDISFSTNMIGNAPNIFCEFLHSFPKNKRWVLRIQVSVDGPEEITDINRQKGASKEIIENVCKLIKYKSDHDSELNHIMLICSCKATLTLENMKWATDSYDNLKKFYLYFDDAYARIKESNVGNKSDMHAWGMTCGSIAVPGKYTQEDGHMFAKFCKMHIDIENDSKLLKHVRAVNLYQLRLANLFPTNDPDSYIDKIDSSFTSCSAGRSNFGIGDTNDLHMCHRSFFLNKNEYIEELRKTTDIDNWDVSNFDGGFIDAVKYNYISDLDDRLKVSRILYAMGGHHHHTKFRFSNSYSIIKELCDVGLVSPAYKNDDLCKIAAYYTHTAMTCPLENVLNVGSINIIPISLYKIMYNGAFEIMLEHTMKKIGKRYGCI